MRPKFTGLWQHRDFMKLWGGETVSLFGSQITFLALPLTAVLILKATPAQMGILGAVEFLPFLLLSLFAGVWADRIRRRPILISADLGRAALLGSIPLCYALGWLNIYYLYLVALSTGVLTVFFDVAYQSYLPVLVERADLVEGNGKLEVSRSVAQVAGPSLAGTLVQVVTAPIAIVLDALSFLGSALFLSTIRKPEPPPASVESRRSVWVEIGEGLRVVLGNRLLRSIAACTGTSNLFSNIIQAVLTLYVINELKFEPGLYGFVTSFAGVGALIGALVAGGTARRFGVGPTIVWSAFLAGVGMLLVPLAGDKSFLAATFLAGSFFVVGFTGPVYNITQVSLRQAITPHRLQGRMNASMRFMVWGTMPIGSLIGGFLGELIGLRATLVVGAVGSLFAFVWVLASPVIHLQKQPEPVADELETVSALS